MSTHPIAYPKFLAAAPFILFVYSRVHRQRGRLAYISDDGNIDRATLRRYHLKLTPGPDPPTTGRHSEMSNNHSSLLQTAIQNLQISQQAKDRDRPHRTSSDFGSPQSENLELSASEDEGDEFVNVGKGTRPPTRPGSPGLRKLGLRDVSKLSSGESSTDPVSPESGSGVRGNG